MGNFCNYCMKKLVPVGNKRKNGKAITDWETRRMHKKCFIITLQKMELERKYK